MDERADRAHAVLWLGRLADHLERLSADAEFGRGEVPSFDMRSWWSTRECGTSACAIGHGAAAGILPPGLTLPAPGRFPTWEGDDLLDSVDAVAKAYRISSAVAGRLFYNVGVQSMKAPAVVAAIRAQIAVS